MKIDSLTYSCNSFSQLRLRNHHDWVVGTLDYHFCNLGLTSAWVNLHLQLELYHHQKPTMSMKLQWKFILWLFHLEGQLFDIRDKVLKPNNSKTLGKFMRNEEMGIFLEVFLSIKFIENYLNYISHIICYFF